MGRDNFGCHANKYDTQNKALDQWVVKIMKKQVKKITWLVIHEHYIITCQVRWAVYKHFPITNVLESEMQIVFWLIELLDEYNWGGV